MLQTGVLVVDTEGLASVEPTTAATAHTCSTCSLGDLCVALGSDERTLRRLDSLLDVTDSIRAQKHIVRYGERFRGLLAVRSGCFKSYTIDRDGNEQVQGFHLPGELIGLEAVSRGEHGAHVVALTDSATCRLEYTELLRISSCSASLQQQLFRLFSGQLAAQHWRTGDFPATERLATFLVNISARLKERGEDAQVFELVMARSDIANYLGLATETVSRSFGRMAAAELIAVRRKKVTILDPEGLRAAAGSALEIA